MIIDLNCKLYLTVFVIVVHYKPLRLAKLFTLYVPLYGLGNKLFINNNISKDCIVL